MMTKQWAWSGALFAALATGMLTFAQPSYGQEQIRVPVNVQMTVVVANVEKGVDSKKAKPGDKFTAKVVTSTTLNDGTAVPAGSVLEGQVDSATKSEHHGNATLVLTIDKLKLTNGNEIPVKAVIMQVSSFETALGNGGGQNTGPFENSKTDSSMMNSSLGSQGSSSGPHPVPGLTVSNSQNEQNSGTLTQERDNVSLSSENQLQVAVAVIPKGLNTK